MLRVGTMQAMIRSDLAEVSRLAKSKSAHGSTGSPRTDLLLCGDDEDIDSSQ
jgi:hypothetical protein